MKQAIYTASPDSQQIHVWRLNPARQGKLECVQVVDVDGQVQPLVISQDGRFLYAGVRPEFRVIAFHIDSDTGALSQVATAPLVGASAHLSLDMRGRFLFSASYHAGCVSVIQLEQGLPVATVQTIDGLDGCHSANIAPDNRILWIPALKQDRIYLFELAENGTLKPQSLSQVTSLPGAGPRHMAFHPYKPVAYCVNELNASVDVWLYHPEIRCVQNLDMMPANYRGSRWAADIHLTPDGRFLYTCERAASIISIFSVSECGCNLSLMGHQPTETQPRGFNLDKTGNFLISAGQKSHRIALYKIDSQHGTFQLKARYDAGASPMWVAVTQLPES